MRPTDDELRELSIDSDDRDTIVHILAAELRELRAARQWRPIETAPKDGTHVLVTDGGWANQAYQSDDGLWWFANSDEELGFEPTNWMPLPPLPEPPKEERDG